VGSAPRVWRPTDIDQPDSRESPRTGLRRLPGLGAAGPWRGGGRSWRPSCRDEPGGKPRAAPPHAPAEVAPPYASQPEFLQACAVPVRTSADPRIQRTLAADASPDPG